MWKYAVVTAQIPLIRGLFETTSEWVNRSSKMKRYSRRRFLQATAVTAAGAGMAARGPSPLILAAAPKAAKSVTFSYINVWDVKVDTHYSGLQYLYRAFKAQHPEITIKETVDPNDTQKEGTDCAAGACPDLMNDVLGTFWTDQYLLDLTPYLNADPQRRAAWRTRLGPGFTIGISWQGSPGFIHDRCSAIHPLGASSPYFKTLPLGEHGLEWIQPGVPLAHPLDDGTAAVLHRSVDETARVRKPQRV